MAFNNVDAYLLQLLQEKNNLKDESVHAKRLLDQEISRVQRGEEYVTPVTLNNVHTGKHVHLCVKVVVPVKEHPNFNFVGKLLGPKGNSLKRLQESTQTKMAVLGRGSMRDKQKEEEFRKTNEPKYSHLQEDLHVEIEVYATPADAYYRISRALNALQRFLIPDYYDTIRQGQLRELAILHGEEPDWEVSHSPQDINMSSLTATHNIRHCPPGIFKRSLKTRILHRNTSPVNSIGYVDEDSYDFDTDRICDGPYNDQIRCSLREMGRCDCCSPKLDGLYESNGYTNGAQTRTLVYGKLPHHFPRTLRREHPYQSAYH